MKKKASERKEKNVMGTKRESKLTIRLTPEEYKHFLAVQRASGLSQADFLMRAIDNIPLPDGRVLDEYRAIAEKMNELEVLMKNIEPKI
jgi:hypothetical protein